MSASGRQHFGSYQAADDTCNAPMCWCHAATTNAAYNQQRAWAAPIEAACPACGQVGLHACPTQRPKCECHECTQARASQAEHKPTVDLNMMWDRAKLAGAQEERERCANIAERQRDSMPNGEGRAVADVITQNIWSGTCSTGW